MHDTPRVSVILPVRNQADHIAALINRYRESLAPLATSFEFILVVNASQDQSLDVCRRVAQHCPEVRVVHKLEPGWGQAVRAGLAQARGQLVCYTNSARTSPERLEMFLRYGLQNPQVVIKANRRKNRSGYLRRLGSLLFNIECRVLFDLPMWDINGTPKVFPREYIARLNLQQNGDLIDLEFNIRCRQLELEMIEVPVFVAPRRGGRSTTNMISALQLYWGAFALWCQVRSGKGDQVCGL